MKPQDKAAKGLELIKESILDYLKLNRKGVGNAKIGNELGLQAAPDKFTRILSRELLKQLELEGRICSKGKERARLYFPVGHNQ